jgi:hypothetical protein
MSTPAGDESLQDETYLPREDTAEVIDFLSALRARGREAAGPRPRLTGPDGRSVELPEPMFEVLLQVAAAMKAGLAVTVAPHHLDAVHPGGGGPAADLADNAGPAAGGGCDPVRQTQPPLQGTAR